MAAPKQVEFELSSYATRPTKDGASVAVLAMRRYRLSDQEAMPFVYMSAEEARRLGQHLIMLADLVDDANKTKPSTRWWKR